MKPLYPYLVFILMLNICIHAKSQIVNIEQKRFAFSEEIDWYESANLGLNLVQNKKQILSINGGLHLEFNYKGRRFLSLSKFSFIRADGEDFDNNGFQHLRYNVSVKPWLTYELFGQVQYNEAVFLKLRALAGTGFRFTLFERDAKGIYFGTLYMYEYDEESVSDKIHRDHRSSSYLSINTNVGKNAKLLSTTYYQPLFNDFTDYRLSSETSFNIKLFKQLTYKISYTFGFDSRAPEGAPQLVYTLSNGLQWQNK